ncbi:hypothetical protein [Bacteroides clarus]|uniref:Uncharacterized protein n=1 Tax=Bacteroides clarus TaxID=626929 RepID=A0A1Y3Z1N2_9BACE|nr:hypothetical protein [Bacteroides clarus]MCQ1546167.1 hypothetical protein [Bacteroides clarus]OUO00431.1 hypothetical protein B5F97_11870 [Bacteroides clarus]
MAKTFIKFILDSMEGSFVPKRINEAGILKEIDDSLKNLDFYGSDNDKKNMREDVASFNRDFNKATKEAKVEFELSF